MRNFIGLGADIDGDGWDDETPKQWQDRIDAAYQNYLTQKKMTTTTTSTDNFSYLDQVIANREAQAQQDLAIKYSSPIIAPSTTTPIILSNPDTVYQEKASAFDQYAKSGQLTRDFQTISANLAAETKAQQEAYFAQNPAEAKNFKLDPTQGVYVPKELTNYTPYILGGVVAVGVIGYFLLKK